METHIPSNYVSSTAVAFPSAFSFFYFHGNSSRTSIVIKASPAYDSMPDVGVVFLACMCHAQVSSEAEKGPCQWRNKS